MSVENLKKTEEKQKSKKINTKSKKEKILPRS